MIIDHFPAHKYILSSFLVTTLIIIGTAQNQQSVIDRETILQTIDQAVTFFYSINIEGGYVYHYTADLDEQWGEGRTDKRTIEVQPPGTPAVGMSFLRAYRVSQDPRHLAAARHAAQALIKGQNEFGGWGHKIYLDRAASRSVSFDDDQTQSAIRFLMSLDEVVDDPELTGTIDLALTMMQEAQMSSGAWPHMYPHQGNYHDFATFNDAGINDCISVMMQAHRQYGSEVFLESLLAAGRFVMISQLPPPQPGWAQQYNEFLQPAWARSFEPPSVCTQVTVLNIHTLIDLYLYTGNAWYLEAIPDALSWLNQVKMENGLWGRFLEIGTDKALYYDRDRIRVDEPSQLSEERRTGYGYQVDLDDRLEAAKRRFAAVKQMTTKQFPASDPLADSITTEDEINWKEKVQRIIVNQDDQGRWITKQDRFKVSPPGQRWQGEYRTADRISSAVFNENIEVLTDYITWLDAEKK